MAEIEHFCDPNDKTHPKFQDLKDYKMLLYSACQQMDGKSEISINEAVGTGLVANGTLGFFMARIYQFLVIAEMLSTCSSGLRFNAANECHESVIGG
jgi:glycyl-tRNA synthetase